MKRFNIWDGNSRELAIGMDLKPLEIEARDGKSALKKFLRMYAMSTGMYEIHKRCNRWIMTSTYGAWFTAIPLDE